MNELFINLDNPEHLHYVTSTISSLDNISTLNDIIKILSQKIQYNEITSENARIIYELVISRKNELTEELRKKRSSNGKQLTMSPTSISNKVGATTTVLLITNIALTTVMYTLLIISKFLNN